MTRRDRVRAELRVLTGDSQVGPAEAGLLLALRGRWQLQGGDTTTLEPGAGLWWAEGPAGWHATSVDAEAALVAVRFETLTPST
jgi:hypothetical protein